MKRLLILVAFAAIAPSLRAASSSAFLEVTATVLPNCQFSVTNLAFGAYDPLLENAANPLDATADVRLRCTRNAPATIVFDLGRNPRGTTRGLAGGADRLNYEIYRDSARTLRWADGDNSVRVTAAGGRDPQRFTVFARIPSGQEVPPGSYGDILMATVDF